MRKKAKQIQYGANMKIDVMIRELGPNELFTLHTEVATLSSEGKPKGRVLAALNGGALCFEFNEKIFKGPIKNRRIILSLKALMDIVNQYRMEYKKPPILKN